MVWKNNHLRNETKVIIHKNSNMADSEFAPEARADTTKTEGILEVSEMAVY